MKRYLYISILILTAACNKNLISQKNNVAILQYQGKKRTWIHTVKIIDNNSYVILGGFMGELNIGDTTILGNEYYNHFLTFFENDKPVKTRLTDGFRIFEINNNGHYLATGNIDFTTAFIRHYDPKFNLLWQKTFKLDSIQPNSQITFLDLKIGEKNEVFGLMRYVKGEFEYDGKRFDKSGNILIKWSKDGKMQFMNKISESHSFIGLTLQDEIVFAKSKRNFSGHSRDTGEKIVDNTHINESITSDIISNGFFKLVTNNSRPEKYFVIKYDQQGNQLLKAQIFESNSQERTGKIIDLNKNKFLFINTNHPAQPAMNGLSDYMINFFIIDKKKLKILDSWTVSCENIHEDIVFKKHDKFMYVAFTYFKDAKFDGYSLTNSGEIPFNESIAILKYKVE